MKIKSLIKKYLCFKHIHIPLFHHREGANIYKQCRCGKRYFYSIPGGYSPIDINWLNSDIK